MKPNYSDIIKELDLWNWKVDYYWLYCVWP